MGTRWHHSGTNICLDFHGDPCRAGLTIFSDGNHHMALEETIQAFLETHPEAQDVFYATTPPGVLVSYLKAGQLNLGNLVLSRQPDIFIGPDNILNTLQNEHYLDYHQCFMQSRGNVLLVRKGNPRCITSIAGLLEDCVRLFISNPDTEKASYQVYHDTLLGLARAQKLDGSDFITLLSDSTRMVYGQCIHHREAPQAVYDGTADAALVYYHLALRYTRIFPDQFEIVFLSGLAGEEGESPSNLVTNYHAGVLNIDNPYAQKFADFLFSEPTTAIYTQHGLQRP